jgi:hypothetical protein
MIRRMTLVDAFAFHHPKRVLVDRVRYSCDDEKE